MSKIPDKIFCDDKDDNEWGIWFNEPAGLNDVAFIRKDALVELINKKLQESADRLDYRTNKAYAEILDKLNEM